jgi:serine/threonine-protein kinase RsbW
MEPNRPPDPQPPLIRLKGDLDFRTAPEVKETLLAAVAAGNGLTVEMSDVGFVDSSGLSALFEAAKIVRGRQAKIRLLSVHRHVRRLLSASGFIEFFEVEAAPEGEAPPPEIVLAAPPSPIEAVRFELPGVPASVPQIRRRVEDVARAMGFRDNQIRDLLIAVSEAATNAMKHGSPQADQSRIAVHYEPDDDRLIIEVTDEGPGFDPLAVPIPVPEQMREGGMGVFFIRTLMDEVSFSHDEGGTTIRMIKYL